MFHTYFLYLQIHYKTLIFIYFTTGDSSASNVSGVVNAEILCLQQMIKTVHGLSGSFYKALTTFTYETLLDSQKMIYGQVMKVISHLRGCDIFVRCLFNNICTPKTTDVDVVKVVGKEYFASASGKTQQAIVEYHETKSLVTLWGVEQVHRVHKTVYRCVECNHAITNQQNFTVHRCEKYMEKSPLTLLCRKNCGKILRNEYNHEEHESACIGISRVVCGECNCTFNTFSALQKHMLLHKKKKPEMPQCHLCQRVFLTDKNLNIHLDTCEAPHKCRLCEKSFSSKSSLEQHFNKCSKSKFACLFCEYRCITDAQLQDHIQRNHSDQPTFSCSKCPNVYGSNDKLLSHIQMCHSDIFK